MTKSELRDHATAVISAGGHGMTISVPMWWKRPAGFPRMELLSVNENLGVRNYRVIAHRVIEWIGNNK